MERNPNDTFSTPMSGQGVDAGTSDATTGTGATGTSGVGTSGTGTSGTGTPGGGSTLATAKESLQERFGQVKEKATQAQATLADKLEAGAQKLRQRQQPGELAAATDTGSVCVATDERLHNVRDSLAGGMQNTADWLRNGDLKADIETQVREHPGRTLLIALGVGYLLGKAIRR